jgi:hypothetical protein
MVLHIDAVEFLGRVPAVGDTDDIAAIPSATTTVIAIVKKIYATLISLVTSTLTLTETGATLTTDGNEQDVYVNNAPSGIFSPRLVQIDFTNQTAAETVIIREYYRIKTGGNYIMLDENTFAGVQDPLLKAILLKDNRYGIKITMEKTGGVNKDYDWGAVYKI